MYEEVTISSTHPDCVGECLWCTNRVKTGQSRLSAKAEAGKLCPPRTCATLGTADIAES